MLALAIVAGSAAQASDGGPGAAQQHAPRMVLLDVVLNGQDLGTERLLMDDSGHLYASRGTLSSWRVRSFTDSIVVDGEHYVALSQLDGFTVAVDTASQAVRIDGAPRVFEPTVERIASGDDAREMTRSSTGGFVNYEAVVEHSLGETSGRAAVEVGLFTPHGYGISNFLLHAGRHDAGVTRLDTNWTIDRPKSATSIRFGDSITRSGVGGVPLRFAGVQFSRNFAVQPGFVTIPLPSVDGSAALPSAVDVYVNGGLSGSTQVGPGPFRINDIPILSGSGEVKAVVRDLLGRQVVTSIDYYTTSESLRRGLVDFSYEAGFLREDYGFRSNRYGSGFASGTYRVGLRDWITLEAHAAASDARQHGGLGAIMAIPHVGSFTASASVSHGPLGDGGTVALGAERQSHRFSFGMRTEVSSRNYGYLGLLRDKRVPKYDLVGFADYSFDFGSVGVNYVRRRNRDERTENLLSLFGTVPVAQRATLQLSLQYSKLDKQRLFGGLNLVVPLGSRTTAVASGQAGKNQWQGDVSLQRDPPPGPGIGYRAEIAAGEVNSVQGEVRYQTNNYALDAQVARTAGVSGVRLGASGAFGYVGDHLFASRKIDQSFALVDVGGRPNVRIYANDHLVTTSDRNGVAVVPDLLAYDKNVIAIDDADIPLDADVGEMEKTVRPFSRSGVVVRFSAPQVTSLLLRLEIDGQPVPPGADVALPHGEGTVVANNGEVYIRDIKGNPSARVTWDGQSCIFAIDGSQAAPAITSCRRNVDVAARQ